MLETYKILCEQYLKQRKEQAQIKDYMSKTKITLECTCDRFKDLATPCCEFFKQMLNDCKVRLEYRPVFREFGIKLVGSDSLQLIYYCPWCSTKMPERLYEEWRKVLISEYGVLDPDDIGIEDAPAEMQTDEWWKKRGL